MADLLEKISELQQLPEDQHLFCPRVGEEGAIYFPEDVAGFPPETDPAELKERRIKIEEAEERKWTTLKAMEILAYDGDEAKPHKDWLMSRHNKFMQSCDVCIRVFHKSRAEWRTRLEDTYDEDNIVLFLRLVDDTSAGRIRTALEAANTLLCNAVPKARTMRLLESEQSYAFFEALSFDTLLRDEAQLREYFDAPFSLVQTKKRLKLQSYLPAMTRFLFSKDPKRLEWATNSWVGFKRNLLKSEFDWAVQDHLRDVMDKVQMNNLDLSYVPLFWAGMRLIIEKMDKELISEYISSVDRGFYRLMLDHLSLRSEGFFELLATMKLILERAPLDFWDGMNTVTPSNASVAEQVFNSPILKQVLATATDGEEDMQNVEAAFSWIPPFLASVKVSNLGPTVRPFAYALFERYQSEQYTPASRAFCFRQGMKVLTHAFKTMGDYKQPADFVGQVTVNNMLEMLTSHIKLLVTKYQQFKSTKGHEEDLELSLSVIQYAFQLEAKSLVVERQLISSKMPSPTETPSSTAIWRTVLGAIKSSNLDLAIHLLIAGRTLIGVEPLGMKSAAERVPPTVRHFNDRFKILSQSITDAVDRLSDFDPGQLHNLFDNPTAASAIVSLLFSSTEDTRSSVVELLKVISSEDERRSALKHILQTHYRNVLSGLSDSVRQVKQKKAFAPAPSMIKTCADIIDIMCNTQDGILRSRDLESGELGVTLNFWRSLWDMLAMLFNTTEAWSNLGIYDKSMMMDFCRDTMQFADQLFDQYSVFVTALGGSTIGTEDKNNKSDMLTELLAEPAGAMDGFAKWLRLRDEFLSSRSVTLISKLLIRLHDVSIEITANTLSYMERVLSGDVRAKLSTTQQAELQRALETHLGRRLSKEEEPAQPKQGSLSKWMSGTTPADGKARLLGSITQGATAFQQRREQMKADVAKTTREKALADEKNARQEDFKKKRQLEKQRLEKERAAALAKAKKDRGGMPSHIAEAGSGLEGLGVLGKDQAVKGEGLMHSSDESEASDGDFDEEIFGIKKSKGKAGPKTNIINEVKIQMPTKKKRVVRSVRDMRARLAPDLTPLHRAILGWDYFHQDALPPNARPSHYTEVPGKFSNPKAYQDTFEPLLLLEAWQGLVKAREESQNKPYEIAIKTRLAIDSFAEIGSTMSHDENREISVSEGDIILLSKSSKPTAKEPTCLARIFKVARKQQHIEVSYRVTPSNPLGSSLHPNHVVYGTKIQSITPLEREYGALTGLQYYDLCDEIVRASPSPLLTYSDKHTDPLIQNYDVNKAQAKAIKSSIDNDGFTLIQGPPGSGKTKTITAIVGAILSDTLRNRGTAVAVPGHQRTEAVAKKLLVCAPSNAAVDELVMRFKNGIKTLNGEPRRINIVRIGRSDAMNANVQDVCLDELVSTRLNMSTKDKDDREAKRKVFDDHKQVCARFTQLVEQLRSGELKGDDADKVQLDLDQLKKQKIRLSVQIQNIKDEEQSSTRNADIDRRAAQQAILNDAHVICATLSGSGHNMFQGLSIEFETVIIDEAAQCVEMSALIPLKYGCAKCILVGDPKQLPPTVFSKVAQSYQFEQSLFVRMQKNSAKDVHLLDTQYRMHPEISLFPSRTFYDAKLLDGGNMAALRKQPWHKSMLLGPYRFFDVQGQHQAAPQGHSLINLAEIDIAMKLYKRLTSDFPDYNFKGKIGIITPYKSQLRELKNRFGRTYGDNILTDIEFNTTDAFQGRESEIIIFSCVRASESGGIGFLQDIRRMNVGLTRAKSSMWVLGNSQSLQRGEFWRRLLEDARERKRLTTGDLNKMLNQHSSNFPAPKEGYEQPHRPVEVKSEPMSRSASGQSNSTDRKPIKQEIKEEIKQEPTLVHHPKRKAERNGDFDLFKDDNVGDVDMEDAPSDSGSNTLNGESGRSTPVVSSDTPRKSETPGADAGKTEPDPGHVMSAMSKPKIRLQARKPASPFIKQKKKPRTG